MQIYLTEVNGTPLCVEAGIIAFIRVPTDKTSKAVMLETHVVTTMMGPNGYITHSVKETAREVGRLVNYARSVDSGKEFSAELLGFPTDA